MIINMRSFDISVEEEIRCYNQAMILSMTEEQKLADILQPNTTIIKIGNDLRTSANRNRIERICDKNRKILLSRNRDDSIHK